MVLPKKNALPWLRWSLLAILALAWCVAAHEQWLNFLENRFVDWRFRFRGEIDAPVNIVYVDIDSQSLAEIGGMPWSRSYFARVAAPLIERAGVKAIGIDVVFSENGVAESVDWKKRVAGNRELAKYLAAEPPVVVGASYAAAVDRDINGQIVFRELPLLRLGGVEAQGTLPELPAFRLSEKDSKKLWSPALVGLIDTIDGGSRVVPAFALTEARPYFYLAVELARLRLGVARDGLKIGPRQLEFARPDGAVVARVPLRDGQLIDVNWFSAWRSPRNLRVPFSTVFAYAEMLASENTEERQAAENFFAQSDFRDAVVLIGPVDPLLQDLAPTPFDEVAVPKVGIHGNVVKTILSGRYLRSWPEQVTVLLTLGLSLGVAALAVRGGVRGVGCKVVASVLVIGYVVAAFLVFQRFDFVLPLAAPLGAVFAVTFAAVGWQLRDEEKQKGRIKGMFGTYVSPQLVDRMIDSGETPQLGGHEEEITAYFSDIQSFSTFSEKLGSGPLVELMNEYLTACTDIVQEEGGTLDKYIGDAVVAMFGAPIALPDHAYRACVAAQRVQRKLAELRAKWQGEGGKWPEIVWRMQSRIGLNSGPATIGNMGSRTRFNYTMMGDNVNLAARMESGAKVYGVYTMVTEATMRTCEQHGGDRVVFRFLDKIVVKGRSQPVPVYEIVGLSEHVTSETREALAIFADGIAHYHAQRWDEARAKFEASAQREPNRPGETPGVETNPSLVMLARCAELQAHPPGANWDGVYVMKSK